MEHITPTAFDPNDWSRPLMATGQLLTFGDTVRVRLTPATEAKGLAGPYRSDPRRDHTFRDRCGCCG